MLYIVLTTPKCNLHCNYCGGSLHGMPDTITYDPLLLKELIGKDREAVVAFYGGEPLLQPDIVIEFLERLPAKYFVINTNGYYIDSISSYLDRFSTILLSVDGREKTTDYYRGEGCYKTVKHAVERIKQSSFSGELIARMAVSNHTDIFEDVMHLLDFFPYVHWQLDAVWSALWDVEEFSNWVEESYKPGLKKLISYWTDEYKKGHIVGIIPFLGIFTRLFSGDGTLPCGAGTSAFTITTDGSVLACPIAPDFMWNNLGDLHHFNHVSIDDPCPSCAVYSVCGGRCLFTNKERLWGKEGFDAICDATKFLIDELSRVKTEFHIDPVKVSYPPYNNSTEIIP